MKFNSEVHDLLRASNHEEGILVASVPKRRAPIPALAFMGKTVTRDDKPQVFEPDGFRVSVAVKVLGIVG